MTDIDETTNEELDVDSADKAEVSTAIPGDGQMAKSLVAGLIPAVILGWTLLSFGLSLPFMLGLFFFVLFGLIIGAAMYRFGAPSRPIPSGKVVGATFLVALTCWSLALVKESQDFPDDFVKRAMDIRAPRGFYFPDWDARVRAKEELYDYIDAHLKENYPPGGTIGYFRLAASGRPVIVELPGQPKKVEVKPAAKAWVWWSRVVLALAMSFWAIYSQTGTLSRLPEE